MVEPDLQLLERLGKRRTASSYATCLYRYVCGVGYSNGRVEAAHTLIGGPGLNVPEAVREGVVEALAASVTSRTRRTRAPKFCFETSEDSVT